MTDQEPGEDIRAGMSGTAQGATQGEDRRARRIASGFKPSEMYDRLIKLRDEGSPRWGDLDRSTQLRVAMYESQRQVAADQGVDITPPAA